MEKKLYECLRCGWKWVNRKDGTPNACPGCRSVQWNTPAANVREAYGKYKMKFPVSDLKIGEERLLPWIQTPNGQNDSRANGVRNMSIKRWAERNGQKFAIFPEPRGIKVRRIA